MKKIPTMFQRDWGGDRSRVLNIQHEDCSWVFAGEGVATKKIDGTCCLVRDGVLYKRREMKAGQKMPDGFESLGVDAETGKEMGWVPVGPGPEDALHREAFSGSIEDGTHELVGPKVQSNPEGYASHKLVAHSSLQMPDQPPRGYSDLRDWLVGRAIEGLVFQHPDGRMAKIKLRDFGLKREGAKNA